MVLLLLFYKLVAVARQLCRCGRRGRRCEERPVTCRQKTWKQKYTGLTDRSTHHDYLCRFIV